MNLVSVPTWEGLYYPAFTVATIVPFFKTTGLLDRFNKATPALFDPGLIYEYEGTVYSSRSSLGSVTIFHSFTMGIDVGDS